MKHNSIMSSLKIFATGTAVVVLASNAALASASTWGPTLLVNTESFQIIDDGDGTTDIEIRFGDSVDERLLWDITNGRFNFSDDLHVDGNIEGSGSLKIENDIATDANLTINEDNGGADAVLTFGNDGGAETLTFSDATNDFIFSDDLHATGNLSASGTFRVTEDATFGSGISLNSVMYLFPGADGSASGKVLKTDSNGNLSWSDDIDTDTQNPDQDLFDTIIVSGQSNVEADGTSDDLTFVAGTNMTITTSGDEITFNASDDDTTYSAGQGLSLGGTVFTLNANLTGTSLDFTTISGGTLNIEGAMSGDTLTVSGDATVGGTLTVTDDGVFGSGITVTEDATFGSGISLNGVMYMFPGADGASSGKVLATDSSGNLSWTTVSDSDSLTAASADGRYVNIGGDTMTGKLTINLTSGTDALEVMQIFSGAFIHAEQSLTSSGELVVEGTTTLNGATTINSTLDTTGAITTDGNLTINEDNTGADAVLTFGNDATPETLTFSDSTNDFIFSDDLHVTDNLSASGTFRVTEDATFGSGISLNSVMYMFPGADGSASGKVLKTDSNGNLSWSDDTDTQNPDQNLFDTIAVSGQSDVDADTTTDTLTFVAGTNVTITTSGDSITFNASDDDTTYSAGQGLSLGGTVFTLNANLTGTSLDFTTMSGDMLTVSGDADIGENMNVQGNMSGDTLNVDSGTVNINGVSYAFTDTQGSTNDVLTNDGAGNLTWAATSAGNGSGQIVFLSPEYPHAIYFFSGSTYVGQLSASGSVAEGENFYQWVTTRGSLQDYWISTRVRVPDNFSSWDADTPIEFRYRTGNASTAVNALKVEMLDTAGSIVPLTGGNALANTSWTTATVTGPEATGTYTAGGYVTIYVKLQTTSAGYARAGWLELNWGTTTP